MSTFTIDAVRHLKVRYPLRSAVGQSLYVSGFETAELDFVRKTLRPGDVFLDVGANAGIFTVVAATRVGPSGRVHAFEPGLAEQALLRQNLALNGLTNVTLFDGAVSDRTGSAQLAVAEDGALSSLARTGHPLQRFKEWRTVPCITLDDYVLRERVAQVNFLKVDVEGAEKLVFDGATRLLGSAADLTILFEAFEPNARAFGYSVQELLTGLLERGLKLSHLDGEGELVPIARLDPSYGTEIYNFIAQT